MSNLSHYVGLNAGQQQAGFQPWYTQLCDNSPGGVGQTTASRKRRGKSGLHRAECQVTPGRRKPTASATENKPPNGRKVRGKGEMAG